MTQKPDQHQREQRSSRIPRFASREEEAAFWDTHDITEFEDELEANTVRFSKHLSEGITIRLQPETLATLRKLAHEQGIGPTTLARMWLLERLREAEKQRSAS